MSTTRAPKSRSPWLIALLLIWAGCDLPENPCAEGEYDPGPPRRCYWPDGGATLLDDPGASDASLRVDAACAARLLYRDADGDGFGNPVITMSSCTAVAGWVNAANDCDDTCAACHPGGLEVCDPGMLDEDCEGGANDGCACVLGEARPCAGGSDTGDCRTGAQQCEDGRWAACLGRVDPVAEECNSQDDDCNGLVDDGPAAASCSPAAHATAVTCSAGACSIGRCDSSWNDCNGDYTDGCEAQFGTLAACTGCGDACGWACDAGGCNDGVRLAVGGAHGCAVADDGLAYCWGTNSDGQLGDGTITSPRTSPVRTTGTPISSLLATGGQHSCAVTPSGTLRCWGANGRGQLGLGSTASQSSGTIVFGVASVVAIGAGAEHTCVAVASGSVSCWGYNAFGQLGDGTTTQRSRPVSVSVAAAEFALGRSHSCARSSTGMVRCWGWNGYGQLGDGSTTQHESPVVVAGLTAVTSIAAGSNHTCAVVAGAVHCWGRNESGQVGDGTIGDRPSPVLVAGIADTVQIAAGQSHTCALRSSGAIWCWGANDQGQLGNGDTTSSSAPRLVPGLLASEIHAGLAHTCALATDGGVWCWGAGGSGRLGDGATVRRVSPVRVLSPSP